MHRAAVLGSPISHSLSPVLHRAAYAAAGLDGWSYTAVEVRAAQLVDHLEGLDETWCGLSLTMPLKETAFAVAVQVSDIARSAHAINTLLRRPDGRWDADNTDVHGIVSALRTVEHDGAARILGAGATARSALVALRTLGVERVEVAARRADAAGALVDVAVSLGLEARTTPLEQWGSAPPRLVVSTVPASAGPALAAATSLRRAQDVTLFDVVYVPWPSPLAAAVQGAGGRAVSGLEMLIHQAARQVELFTGVPGDVDAMRAAVRSPR